MVMFLIAASDAFVVQRFALAACLVNNFKPSNVLCITNIVMIMV